MIALIFIIVCMCNRSPARGVAMVIIPRYFAFTFGLLWGQGNVQHRRLFGAADVIPNFPKLSCKISESRVSQLSLLLW